MEQTVATSSARVQQLLLVCHSADLRGEEILANIGTALEFAKLSFSVIDLARNGPWPDLERYDAIVVCTEMVGDWNPEQSGCIRQYVRAGGGLVFACRSWNADLFDVMGFRSDATELRMHETNGLIFDADLVRGAKGLKVADADWFFDHSRIEVSRDKLAEGCNTLVSDGEGNPIVWRHAVGRGNVHYWNTNILFCRALRGFIIQSILDVMGIGVCAIGGFAMFHIDDFPPSLSDAMLEPIATEFPNLCEGDFYFDVWQADMIALRAKHDLKYTYFCVMNYGEGSVDRQDVDPSEVALANTILKARCSRALETPQGDEFGFHGYNHLPLVADLWPDIKSLHLRLALARRAWQAITPWPLPTAWVPASNQYQQPYLQALKESFPEITTACSLHSIGEPELGEYREFAKEPWHEGLFCLPRETYGYVLKPEVQMMMLSQLGSMGVWTHFVHPDDVYDVPSETRDAIHCRNPQNANWRTATQDGVPGLLTQLDDWIGQLKADFPWLEFLTTSQAECRCRTHIENDVRIVKREDAIEILSRAEGLFYVKMRENYRIATGGDGGELLSERTVDNGILHTVRCPAGGAIFHLEKVFS